MHNTGRFQVYVFFFSLLLYRQANSLSLYNNTYVGILVYAGTSVDYQRVSQRRAHIQREVRTFPAGRGQACFIRFFFSLKLCTKQKLRVDFNSNTDNVRERRKSISRIIYKSSVRIRNVRRSIVENKSNTYKTSINIEYTPTSLTFSFRVVIHEHTSVWNPSHALRFPSFFH